MFDKKKFIEDETKNRLDFEKIMLDRHTLDINSLNTHLKFSLDEAIKKIEKRFTNRLGELDIFKKDEEIIGNNVFGKAVIDELVRRAFVDKDKDMAYRENEINRKEIDIKHQYNELDKCKNTNIRTNKEIIDKQKSLNEEMHKALRKTKTNQKDEHYTRAKELEYAIKIIKWITKQ